MTDERSVDQRLEALEHPRVDNSVTKEIVKEALKEWLDDKFAEVGKWTLHGLVAAALAALAYFVLTSQGWKHP